MADNVQRACDRTHVSGFIRRCKLYQPAYNRRKSNSNHLHFKDPLFVRRDCPFRRNLTNTGETPVQLSTMSSSAIVFDRVDSLVLREAGFDFCTPSTSCLIPAGQSLTVSIGNWFTDEPFFQAKLSGPYTAFAGLAACPTNGPCLAPDFLSLRIVVSVPQN